MAVLNDKLEKESVEIQKVNYMEKVSSPKYTRKKISLVNPPKRNIMGDAHSEFTRAEVALAKSKHKLAVAEGRTILLN